MKRLRSMPHLLVAVLLPHVFGCNSGSELATGSPRTGSKSTAIIGGFPAEAWSFNAVGALGTVLDEKFDSFCTGTLITPTLVVTARHCAWMPNQGAHLDAMRVYFAVGPDSARALETVEANHVWLSPQTDGGLWFPDGGFGNDVAVYQLIRPITSVMPIPVAPLPLTEADLGQKFLSMGYGLTQAGFPHAHDGINTRRNMGTGSLRALDGRFFEHIFGSLEKYVEHEETVAAGPLSDSQRVELKTAYEESELLPGYDAYVAREEGDVQPCFGDSGGPLLRRVPGVNGDKTSTELQVYGVVSGGHRSAGMVCDYGTWYALIGPMTQALVATAAAFEDPCEGLSVHGNCEGDVAIRCTKDPLEGARRRTSIDCASLGLVCDYTAALRATCLEPESPAAEGQSLPADAP